MSGSSREVDRIQRWVDEFAPTFACWDLISLLRNSGPGVLPLSYLTSALNLDDRALRRACDHLERGGIIEVGESGEVTYCPGRETETEIESFLETLQTRQGRLVAVSRVLEKAVGDT